MKLTKKGEYALKALIELALNHDKGVNVTLINSIAERENIPPRYLEQILLNLKKAGLLISKRGVGGGYALSRLPQDISLGDIIEAVEGPFLPVEQIGKRSKDDISSTLYETMKEVSTYAKGMLDNISLEDMAVRVRDLAEKKKGILNYTI